ncbi:hypothetical protein MKK69_09155 [Methylobacterium sp. J-026]|jgi:hypothetical protein|uniref:hypothetical protein n=1 Tax=unclassified Methylobacterium TaxID=2615210 RepID=UPI0011CA7282|nr:MULTISPECIES: hypothetical protein [unclassified Methylobacterium]MCJ2134219.1 hypothetical protein [Methylobacterium sp. J-026]TXM71192.1 hypothetical protein FV229_00515 [Methylobacterium sp. WL120]
MRYVLDINPSRREPGRLNVQLTVGPSGCPVLLDTLDGPEIPRAVMEALSQDLAIRLTGEPGGVPGVAGEPLGEPGE